MSILGNANRLDLDHAVAHILAVFVQRSLAFCSTAKLTAALARRLEALAVDEKMHHSWLSMTWKERFDLGFARRKRHSMHVSVDVIVAATAMTIAIVALILTISAAAIAAVAVVVVVLVTIVVGVHVLRVLVVVMMVAMIVTSMTASISTVVLAAAAASVGMTTVVVCTLSVWRYARYLSIVLAF